MKILKLQSGQMGIKELIAIGSAIVIPFFGLWFGQSNRSDAKLELAREEQKVSNLALIQRIATNEIKTAVNETKTENLNTKVEEIRVDVKEILRRLK